jgi:trk system potassium uptake protein TrkA
MKKQQFAVLGLGRFGQKVARELYYRNQEVIVVDQDEAKIQAIKDEVTNAYLGDISDEKVLREAGVADCDVVIIAESSNIESNIIATQVCRNLRVKQIIVKAQNTLHGRILEKLEANYIIFPEQDAAIKLVNRLSSYFIMDYFEIGGDHSVLGIKPQDWMLNKSLAAVKLVRNEGVTVLAIRRGTEMMVVPPYETVIKEGDVIILFGSSEAYNKLGLDISHKT